jgi:hypothetical protein
VLFYGIMSHTGVILSCLGSVSLYLIKWLIGLSFFFSEERIVTMIHWGYSCRQTGFGWHNVWWCSILCYELWDVLWRMLRFWSVEWGRVVQRDLLPVSLEWKMEAAAVSETLTPVCETVQRHIPGIIVTLCYLQAPRKTALEIAIGLAWLTCASIWNIPNCRSTESFLKNRRSLSRWRNSSPFICPMSIAMFSRARRWFVSFVKFSPYLHILSSLITDLHPCLVPPGVTFLQVLRAEFCSCHLLTYMLHPHTPLFSFVWSSGHVWAL